MPLEIERKFLVTGEFKHLASASHRIAQGYLASSPGPTVRVRIKGDKGYITIKGKSSHSGLVRYEWEKEIPVNEAQELLELCQQGIIDKTRYEVKYEGQTYEVDEFHAGNEGLILAELELDSIETSFTKPEWLGEEVTGNNHYYNSYLSKHPYSGWKNNRL